MAMWGLTSMVANLLIRLGRQYIRHFPLQTGKTFVYKQLMIRRLGVRWRRVSATVTTIDGASMEIALPDLIQSRIYFFGVWEPAISAFVRSRLEPGDSFIDVGANIGYYTVLASRRVGPSGSVYAVEASPKICSRLRRNVALNGAPTSRHTTKPRRTASRSSRSSSRGMRTLAPVQRWRVWPSQGVSALKRL